MAKTSFLMTEISQISLRTRRLFSSAPFTRTDAMSSYDSGQNERSPREDAQSSKRRRIALACLDCRRRKLKCDRIFPACSRCQKGGHADTCIYDPDAIDAVAAPSSTEKLRGTSNRDNATADNIITSRPVATPTSFVQHHVFDTDDSRCAKMQARIHQLESRIIGLENATNKSRQWPEMSKELGRVQVNAGDETDPEDRELMLFRGKNFNTVFYGASHHMSYLSHLPTMRVFMKEMVVQHPGLAHVQKELKSMKIKGHEQASSPSDGKALFRLLPQKEVADQLVQIYIDNFESTYRVLYLPLFWQEYSNLWDAPADARPAFIALLLLVLATTCCVRPRNQSMFRGDSSLERETAIKWIEACDKWLEKQSQKHAGMTIFQIHCLSFIAQQINSVKRKRTWTSAGTLMRVAMSAGLHRDAEIVNLRHGNLSNRQVSSFDQEMRRRLWTTVSELELQTSLDRGMPAMLRELIADCGPPLNVDDEEIYPSVDQLPTSRPISHHTRSSFQNLCHSTWTLRLELVSLVNGPARQLQYEDVLLYDRRIVQALDEIPYWNGHGASVSRTLLQLQLQQILLLLHRPYVLYDTQSSRYDYSAVVHLRAAMTILDLHQKLITAGNPVLCVLRNDILGAALSVCYNFSVSRTNPDHKLSTWSMIVGLTDPVQYLEKALSMLADKIMRLGVGLQEYYCICSAIGLHKKKTFATSNNEEFQAAERVSKMIQKVLSLQDNFSAAATLASLPTMPAATANGVNGVHRPSGNGNGLPAAQMDSTAMIEDFSQDLEGFDLSNISGWDLDAFFNF